MFDDAALLFEFDVPTEVVVPEAPPPPARGRPRLRLRLPIEGAEAFGFGFPGADFLVGNPLPTGMLLLFTVLYIMNKERVVALRLTILNSIRFDSIRLDSTSFSGLYYYTTLNLVANEEKV